MIKFKEKKLIIFDLDGVLISSLDNMKKSWNNTVSKFSIDKDFKKYKDYMKTI